MAMRSCDPFEIPMPADIVASVAHVRAAIEDGGGTFEGDETTGRFIGSTPVGSIEGAYVVEASVIRVTITQKPMMAPCGAIESRIRGYFS